MAYNPYQNGEQPGWAGAPGNNNYGGGYGGQPAGYGGTPSNAAYNPNQPNMGGQTYGDQGNPEYHEYKDQQNPEGGAGVGELYDDSRNGFIRKVYTIVAIQLLVCVLFCVAAMLSTGFGKIFGNTVCIIICSVSLTAISFVISCCRQTMRKYGLIILIIFTLLFAFLIAGICGRTKPQVVLAAVGIAAVLVIGLTAYACFTKTDFTGCGPYLFIFCLVLFCFGIVLIFWRNPIAYLVYACLGAFLYCVYLIFDTQLILGRAAGAYSIDEAYLAAIMLFTDIVQIFLQLLNIIQYADNS